MVFINFFLHIEDFLLTLRKICCTVYKKGGDNMVRSLGTTLKELRKNKKLTAKETADRLSLLGYEISEKTISGYETGIRMPNADVFMALCTIYECKNILEMFSFIKADYSIPTDSEWKMIEKYRNLDVFGKESVELLLDRESERVKEIKQQKEYIEKLEAEYGANNF